MVAIKQSQYFTRNKFFQLSTKNHRNYEIENNLKFINISQPQKIKIA